MTVRVMVAVLATVGMLTGCTNGSNPDGSFGVSNDLIGSGPFGLHPVLSANPKTTGYITRINLDADAAHRVTIMASKDRGGAPLDAIDGSTWDPFAQRLLFTSEDSSGPEYQATLGFPSLVEDISGAIGRGGYEGI